MIKMIAITDSEYGISKNGDIPWSFKEDREYFCARTINQVVIMGRKTFSSLPDGPLKDRTNCIISTSMSQSGLNKANFQEVMVFKSLEEAIEYYKNDVWIIGGATLYNYALSNNIIDYAVITKVKKNWHADTFLDISALNKLKKQKILFENEKFLLFSRSEKSF